MGKKFGLGFLALRKIPFIVNGGHNVELDIPTFAEIGVEVEVAV